MAFAVMNVVQGARDEVTAIVQDVRPMLDAIREQAGFRGAHLYQSEDGGEGVLIMEWESRDAFMAYRQSETGRHSVESALKWHPKISFFEVVAVAGPSPRA